MQNGGEFNEEGHDQMHIFSRYMGDGLGWSCGSEEKDCKFRNSRANKKADSVRNIGKENEECNTY